MRIRASGLNARINAQRIDKDFYSGFLRIHVNLPFWSDHAIKRRWFTLPDANATFT